MKIGLHFFVRIFGWPQLLHELLHVYPGRDVLHLLHRFGMINDLLAPRSQCRSPTVIESPWFEKKGIYDPKLEITNYMSVHYILLLYIYIYILYYILLYIIIVIIIIVIVIITIITIIIVIIIIYIIIY